MTDQTSATPLDNQIAESINPDVDAITARSLQQIANGSLILATILLFLNLYLAAQTQNIVSGSVAVILFLLTFFAAFFPSFSHNLRTTLLIIAFLGTGVASVVNQGINANGILYFFSAVIISAVLLPRKRWYWILGISALLLTALAILISSKVINLGLNPFQNNRILSWASVVTETLFLTYLVSAAASRSFSDFKQMIAEVRKKDIEISDKDQALTQQINSLEKQLDRRKFRMVAARQISREIAQQTDLEVLLPKSAELIRSQFDYYYTGIFLKDEKSEFAVLKAGTGDAGAEMLSRQHKLRLREEGVVGYVVAKGEIRIASDVDQDSVHYKNPSLPLTRSEMAVPLRVGNQIIGALDVQSQNPKEFDSEDAEFLQTIADTLAASIDKVSQIQLLKQDLANLEEKNREYTSRVWQSHLKGSRKKLNFRYFASQTQAVEERAPLFRETLANGEPLVTSAGAGTGQGVMLAVPIKLRDQVLGVVNIKYEGQKLPDELFELINTASDRLALSLENARLLEEIQERAEREHMVANISEKVRAATDVDSILKTTAAELGKSLGVAEVRIQLKTVAVE